jgi:riboflavin kinase/FMN adenylyltransferase
VRVLRSLADFDASLAGGVVTIGNFDGVHVGHARLIECLKQRAERIGGPAIVFTFDPHPVRLLRPQQCPPPLTWTERKAVLLARLGVDALVAYPTDAALLALSAQEFFDKIVCGSLAARALVEGPNFRFGRDRAGDVALLETLCHRRGLSLDVVEPVEMKGDVVSSSRIRRLVAVGDVRAANHMLTSAYRVRGMVTHGAGRGSQLGFPTANLEGIDTLLPAHGVYAGRGFLGDASWPAAVNIGPNPTFGEHADKVEAHLIGLDAVLYGQVLELDLLERLREIQAFDSRQELVDQLARDVLRTRDIVAASSISEVVLHRS